MQERRPQQRAIGMSTSLAQARALYEFYDVKKTDKTNEDDARSSELVHGWTPMKPDLLDHSLPHGAPANKRTFHLVFRRSIHSGESAAESGGSTQLAQAALQEALEEAKNRAADNYKVTNPFGLLGDGQR